MRRWLVRGGLLAALMLPGCATYESRPGPLYAAHPGSYPAPFYDPYYRRPGYYSYGPAPRSSFTFSFGAGKQRHWHGHRPWRHGHHHRWHHHRGHHHRWHR